MCMNISCAEMEGAGLFSVVPSDGKRGSRHKLKNLMFSVGFFLMCESVQNLEKLQNHCLWRC